MWMRAFADVELPPCVSSRVCDGLGNGGGNVQYAKVASVQPFYTL
jgi:hypothetical protein